MIGFIYTLFYPIRLTVIFLSRLSSPVLFFSLSRLRFQVEPRWIWRSLVSSASNWFWTYRFGMDPSELNKKIRGYWNRNSGSIWKWSWSRIFRRVLGWIFTWFWFNVDQVEEQERCSFISWKYQHIWCETKYIRCSNHRCKYGSDRSIFTISSNRLSSFRALWMPVWRYVITLWLFSLQKHFISSLSLSLALRIFFRQLFFILSPRLLFSVSFSFRFLPVHPLLSSDH